MSDESESKLKLNGNTVKITTAVAAAVAAAGFVWSQSAWQTKVDIRLDTVVEKIAAIDEKVVGKSSNGWHKHNMRSWVREFQAANPDLAIPVPENDFVASKEGS